MWVLRLEVGGSNTCLFVVWRGREREGDFDRSTVSIAGGDKSTRKGVMTMTHFCEADFVRFLSLPWLFVSYSLFSDIWNPILRVRFLNSLENSIIEEMSNCGLQIIYNLKCN